MTTTNWLHSIGEAYYTPARFLQEAEKEGPSRAVGLLTLRTMHWGDPVFCTSRHGAKSHLLFTVFPVRRITGLSKDAANALEALGAQAREMPPRHVHRGCGHYRLERTFAVTNLSLEQVATVLQELKTRGVDIGRTMIGCDPGDFRVQHSPFRAAHKDGIRLHDMKRGLRGFRPFDAERCLLDDLAGHRARGLYYVLSDAASAVVTPATVPWPLSRQASWFVDRTWQWGSAPTVEQVSGYTRIEDDVPQLSVPAVDPQLSIPTGGA